MNDLTIIFAVLVASMLLNFVLMLTIAFALSIDLRSEGEPESNGSPVHGSENANSSKAMPYWELWSTIYQRPNLSIYQRKHFPNSF